MNRMFKILIGLTLAAVPLNVAVAQSVTYPRSGIMDGQRYTSITINYDTQQVRYNFEDGTFFTVGVMEPVMFRYLVQQLEGS